MPADLLSTHRAFHLTGRRAAAMVEFADRAEELPAPFARHRNLPALRYDFPLILADGGKVETLSGVVDRLLPELAPDNENDGRRLSHHLLRLERRMRQLSALGASGERLSTLWTFAALQLQVDRDRGLKESLDRARAALKTDGEVVDCDRALPARVFVHLWRAEQAARAVRVQRRIDASIRGLEDVLQTDFDASPAGRAPAQLRAGFGSIHREDFDFEAMSQVLSRVPVSGTLPERRRERIESALRVLRDQRFFSTDSGAYAFTFPSCAAALEAFWRRRTALGELARAVELAALEIEGSRDAASHERLADAVEAAPLDLAGATSPDYLVVLEADALDPAEQIAVMDGLAAGLPLKVLVQTNDVLDAPPLGMLHFGFGARGRQLVDMAIGLNDVYVLQVPGSHLFRRIEAVRSGLRHAGPALFNVFSGASGHAGGLAPYLVAAAALESRAFPMLLYDPSAGPDWASRLSLDGNPQPAADWPLYRFTYETAEHQAMAEDLAFTLADFVGCDDRYAGHFARIEPGARHHGLAPLAETLALEWPDRLGRVPFVAAVDSAGRLSRLLVDDVLVQEARRCRDRWHRLRELAGIDTSHARRLLEQGGAARPAQSDDGAAGGPSDAASVGRSGAEPAAGAAAAQQDHGDPYIETPRCSSCNECIQINGRMFAYNENRQAYIADPAAGTYRQLIEAAESCQISIIHPGRPRNAAEPGLDGLLARAEAFAG